MKRAARILPLSKRAANAISGSDELANDDIKNAEIPAISGAHDVSPAASVMAAMLAHEIKNPLAGIRGAAQLLGQRANSEDLALTDLICREVDRINALFKKMEFFTDEPMACDQPVNIHEVLEYVRHLAEDGFAQHVRIDSRYDPSLPDVMGDRELLIQLFLNLLKNAAEALGHRYDGVITITTRYLMNHHFRVEGKGSSIRLPIGIIIEDNGGGIAPEIAHNLFDPFVTNKPDGKGLGLAIVAKIVGNHNGMIALDPAPAGHTRFKLMLPAYKA